MVNYVQIDNDTWVRYDPVTASSTVLKKSLLLEMKARHEETLAGESLSDVALLVWAKMNYPTPEIAREIQGAKMSIAQIDADLEGMNGS